MVNLYKIKIAFLEDRSDINLYQIHSEGIENCHFHVFAILSYDRCRPSRTVQ